MLWNCLIDLFNWFFFCHKLMKLQLNIGSFNQVPVHRFVINFRAKRLLLTLSRLHFLLLLFLLFSCLSHIPHGLAHHKASKESCLTFCSIDLTSREKKREREREREGEGEQSLPNQFSCFLLCVICFLSLHSLSFHLCLICLLSCFLSRLLYWLFIYDAAKSQSNFSLFKMKWIAVGFTHSPPSLSLSLSYWQLLLFIYSS